MKLDEGQGKLFVGMLVLGGIIGYVITAQFFPGNETVVFPLVFGLLFAVASAIHSRRRSPTVVLTTYTLLSIANFMGGIRMFLPLDKEQTTEKMVVSVVAGLVLWGIARFGLLGGLAKPPKSKEEIAQARAEAAASDPNSEHHDTFRLNLGLHGKNSKADIPVEKVLAGMADGVGVEEAKARNAWVQLRQAAIDALRGTFGDDWWLEEMVKLHGITPPPTKKTPAVVTSPKRVRRGDAVADPGLEPRTRKRGGSKS